MGIHLKCIKYDFFIIGKFIAIQKPETCKGIKISQYYYTYVLISLSIKIGMLSRYSWWGILKKIRYLYLP